MKMNKKGFTLIEMLVVIAIIAVLVAIVIPTVSSATDKAAAATNAANLRSWKATVTTGYLSGDVTVSGTTVTVPSSLGTAPNAKKCGNLKTEVAATVVYNETTNDFTVYFGSTSNTIDAFSKVADGTTKANTIVAAGAAAPTTCQVEVSEGVKCGKTLVEGKCPIAEHN